MNTALVIVLAWPLILCVGLLVILPLSIREAFSTPRMYGRRCTIALYFVAVPLVVSAVYMLCRAIIQLLS